MERVAQAVGKPLLPWQAQVLNVAFEYDPVSGVPFYRVVRVAVPRQSGKTTLVLLLEIDRCLNWGDLQHVVYTAQDRQASREKWDEQMAMLARTVLRKQFSVRRQNGSERTTWKATGSTVGITASTETAGHGQTIDLAIVDEAWAQRDERLSASFRPAMMTRRDAQEWWLSTMGNEDSVPWDDRVDDGRARVEAQLADPGQRRGVAYFEWSAPDSLDPYDPDTWRSCMPALGRTVDLETIRTDAQSMPEPDFRRGYLNQRTLGGKPVVPAGLWAGCRDGAARVGSPLCFGADVAADRSWAAIAACSQNTDGVTVVELVQHQEGASWIPGRLVELSARFSPLSVVVDGNGFAGRMNLEALGLPLQTVDTGTFAGACGGFFDAVVDGTIRHIGQTPLDAAVAAARKRNIGDTWAWARRVGLDMTPLVAATLARWGATATLVPAVH